MREPISRDSASPRELVEATRRLDRALEQLEAACAARVGGGPAALAAELQAARARESELVSAAVAASQALGRAATEVRAALGEGGLGDGGTGDRDIGDGETEAASKPDGDGLNEEAA